MISISMLDLSSCDRMSDNRSPVVPLRVIYLKRSTHTDATHTDDIL